VSDADATATSVVLEKYERSIKRDLGDLDNTLRALASLPYFEVFGLDDEMLDRATEHLPGWRPSLSITPYLPAFWSAH
jgi:hypothetical protein